MNYTLANLRTLLDDIGLCPGLTLTPETTIQEMGIDHITPHDENSSTFYPVVSFNDRLEMSEELGSRFEIPADTFKKWKMAADIIATVNSLE